MRSISILGSTGSIGVATLEIIAKNLKDFTVNVLTAHNNIELFIKQCLEFKPKTVAIGNCDHQQKLKSALADYDIKILTGDEGIVMAAAEKSDVTISAIVGLAGLKPTIAAIKNSKIVGLVNKESLVCAGSLVKDLAQKHQTTIIPVDSEHNGIFRTFDFDKLDEINKVTISASGGPFLNTDVSELKNITPKQAVKHPNWSMGAKISVDSATMMNKALELIEAYNFFPIRKDQLAVIIHPESIIHSLVSYIDGSCIAMLSKPDMKVSISYALSYPNKLRQTDQYLEIDKLAQLNFIPPDLERFPALKIADYVLENNGCLPIVMNAANEIAVSSFLKGKISFCRITEIVEEMVYSFTNENLSSFEQVFAVDKETRHKTKKILSNV
jgi:1-deoxy-D-xylulose-5-phosphate reductoisomerase